MKIINRLYFKVVLIATILIASIICFYYMDYYYKNKSYEQYKKINLIKQDAQIKIKILEKELVDYKNKIEVLEKKDKKKMPLKNSNNDNCKVKNIKKQVVEKYRKIIMYNIHHQLVEELKYAPYLPVSQLQEIMQNRFILKNMSFKISIRKNTSKIFDGIKITSKKTLSIIRDNELLEVEFVTK